MYYNSMSFSFMMGLPIMARSSLVISDVLASPAPPVTPYTGLSKVIMGLPVTEMGSKLVCLKEVGIILALSSSLSSSLHEQEQKYSGNSS